MKYLTIVTFIFLIHVSMATINAAMLVTGGQFSDMFESSLSEQMQPSQSWFNSVEVNAKDDAYYTTQAFQDASFGDFVQSAIATAKGIAKFVIGFAFGIVAVPYTLHILGLPYSLAAPLSLPIYLLYIIAIAQFASNRGTKSMD